MVWRLVQQKRMGQLLWNRNGLGWLSSGSQQLSSMGGGGYTTDVLDGKQMSLDWQDEMAVHARLIRDRAGRPPGLGVVLVGDRVDSQVYVMRKQEACDRVGIMSQVKYLPSGEHVTQRQIRQAVTSLSKDPCIDGVLVQLPLPKHIDEEDVIEHFDPRKDVDGFHPLNVGRTLMRGRTARFVPCTALGCIELLRRSGVGFEGKRVVIVGDSNIVGMPLAMLFRDQGTASVTVIHRSSYCDIFRSSRRPVSYQGPSPMSDVRQAVTSSRTSMDDPPHPYQVTYCSESSSDDGGQYKGAFSSPEDIQSIAAVTGTADILVIAVGYPDLVTADWIKPGAIILDVGINSVYDDSVVGGDASEKMNSDDIVYPPSTTELRCAPANASLVSDALEQHAYHVVGDVDMQSVMGKAAAISPVPGGVGPMTVAALMHNTIASAAWRLGIRLDQDAGTTSVP